MWPELEAHRPGAGSGSGASRFRVTEGRQLLDLFIRSAAAPHCRRPVNLPRTGRAGHSAGREVAVWISQNTRPEEPPKFRIRLRLRQGGERRRDHNHTFLLSHLIMLRRIIRFLSSRPRFPPR